MKKKRTYQTVSVERVHLLELLPVLVAGCVVALDVAKQRFVVALATLAGDVVALLRFDHPTQTGQFLAVVDALRTGLGDDKVHAAMEPTGTYGDAIRHQLVRRGVPVSMVSPKQTHDSQALFDNVRSLHDPKSAVLVAKLFGLGLGKPWAPPAITTPRLRALVELRRHEQQRQEVCFSKLEGALARHWPEFGQWMDLREQQSALRLLETHPSPACVTADTSSVRTLLHHASRGRLSKEAVEGVICGAKATFGVPTTEEEEGLVGLLAKQALESGRRMSELERDIAALAKDDELFARLQAWMGTFTAAVVVTHCDPRKYENARQLEKACGLNLREKSSGEHHGRLMITKRGPGLVRKVLYLFALRMLQESTVVRAWYQARRGYTDDSKQRAVVAVMRKLVRAMFHVAKGETFDATKLVDVRRLALADGATRPTAIVPRTTPRSIARGKKRARSPERAAAST